MIKYYRITTNCYWYKEKRKRKKITCNNPEIIWNHWIELENIRTGRKKKLKNGSIIKIIKENN